MSEHIINNEDFDKLLDQYEPTSYKPGSKIDATITRKENEYTYLDINNKSQGRIRSYEVEDFEIGDTIQVQVIREDEEDGIVIVSKQALDKALELESIKVNDIVTGKIFKKNKGGFNVKLKSTTAFLPTSLIDTKGKDVIGQTLEFLVKDKNKNGITLSRVDYVKNQLKSFLNSLNVGDIVKVKVKEVLDFGLIVDLGVTTGLIHISELSWNQVNDIKESFKVGQELEAKVIEINKEKTKIKLSIKQLSPNPWLSIREKYTVGDRKSGTIKEILEFGLVINLDDSEDEGFMHISDISHRKFFKLDKSYKVGDKVDFIISNINDEKERISLSAKELLDEVWENIDKHIQVGDTADAKIVYLQNYGMFIELANKLEAFVKRADYAWNREETPELNEGDTVKVLITEIDSDNKKITASIKDLVTSPYREAREEYEAGDVIEVSITDVLENGYLVKLTERFKGLIPKREALNEYSVGDKVKVLLIDTNESKNSMILSEKRLKEIEEREELDELLEQYGAEN